MAQEDDRFDAFEKFLLLRSALEKLLDANIAGSVKDQFKAQKNAVEALREATWSKKVDD